MRRQLGELLAGPGGQVRPELRVLHETLAGAERPDTALNWLKHAATRTALAELAAGQRPLSHAALDDLPPGKPIEHLRSVLVATAALPARDEQLARIERWVSRAVSEHASPEDKELLHRYPAWHLLRRLRQRNRGAATTYGQLDTVRQRVRAALGLLGWLRERGLTLANCSQADLDTWLASNDATRKAEARHFVRWAISCGINRNLQFAATRWTGPAGPLDQDERWQQARRLLHDDTLDTGERVAGLLVLLYAQRPAAISRLTLDDLLLLYSNGTAMDFAVWLVSWLEYDHGGFGWPQRGVGVEVLVDLRPAGPQPLALVSLRATRTDLSRPVAGLGGDVGVSLQVQPPPGFGRTPPVHRHRDQVAAVLEIAEDDRPRPPGAPAHRGEPQRPPAARLRTPQTHPGARHAHQCAMGMPGNHDEPPRRQPGPPARSS